MKYARCSGRHHVSICAESQTRNSEPTPSHPRSESDEGKRSTPPTQPTNGAQKNASIPVSTAMCSVGVKTPVLLQTAKTTVYKIGDPERTRVVCQRSYITDRIRHHLSLEPSHTETMVIKTFGSENQTKQACDVVRLGMTLSEPLSNQPIALATNNYAIDYAYGDEALEIDMLVGSNQYWRIVTGEVINQHNGPTAVHTRLGWVLSGPIQGLSHQVSSVNLASTHGCLQRKSSILIVS